MENCERKKNRHSCKQNERPSNNTTMFRLLFGFGLVFPSRFGCCKNREKEKMSFGVWWVESKANEMSNGDKKATFSSKRFF